VGGIVLNKFDFYSSCICEMSSSERLPVAFKDSPGLWSHRENQAGVISRLRLTQTRGSLSLKHPVIEELKPLV
jgi:hypothetical protein